MTRRERLENRLAKREEWAAKAEVRSSQAYARASAICERIPLGQPILVGHHSERHARADQRRIHSAMDRSCEEQRLAQHHTQKAIGLSHMLDRVVFSDDDNAIEAIEARIAKREAELARMKTINALYRKGDAAKLAEMGLNLESLRAQVAAIGYSWVKAPFESFELSNLGAKIRTDRKRIDEIKARQNRTEKAEAAGGVNIQTSTDGVWAEITFAEKPERDILNALRSANFHWGGGRWMGKAEAIPAAVLSLVAAPADDEEDPDYDPTPYEISSGPDPADVCRDSQVEAMRYKR